MKEIKNDILVFLKQDLENRTNEWLMELNNPLATEIDFLDQQISRWQTGIERAKELHNKHLHSHQEVSVMQSEIVNFNNKIKVAQEWKEKLLRTSEKKIQSNANKQAQTNDMSPDKVFKNFDLIKEVMRDHFIINASDKYLLNGKQKWKVAALINVITKYSPTLCNVKLSENTLFEIFNSFLKTDLKRGRKDTKEFNDFFKGLERTIRTLL